MSRRKQSNPKPLKSGHLPEDGDGKINEKMDLDDRRNGLVSLMDGMESLESPASALNDQTDSLDKLDFSQQSPKTCKEVLDNSRETTRDQNNKQDEDGNSVCPSQSPMMQGLISHLQLPSDVLYLKKMEVTMHGNTAVCWVVCSAIPLPKGSSLGPFQGQMTCAEKVKVGDMILQFSSKSGQNVLVNVTSQSGAWLALLRPATDSASRNTHVHLEGDHMWCEIVSDMDVGSELIASFTYHPDHESQSPDPTPEPPSAPVKEPETPKQEPPSSTSKGPRSPTNHAALIYGCPFCGVRFSSPRTLQGHLAYYCSKKPPDLLGSKSEVDISDEALNSEEVASNSGQGQKLIKTKESPETKPEEENEESKAPTKRSAERDSQMEQESPPAKTIKTGQVFRCPHCSYTADKLSSLNRHRRIHNRPSDDSDHISVMPVPLTQTYCKECNIQFSSLSTFRGHKEFYCSKRGSANRSDDESSEETKQVTTPPNTTSHSSPSSHEDTSPSTTGNIIFPTGQFLAQTVVSGISSTSVIPGQTAVIFAAPIMAPNGANDMGITMPTVIVQPVIPASSVAKTPSQQTPTEAHQNKGIFHKMTLSCMERPLDLSKKKTEKHQNGCSEEKPLKAVKDDIKPSNDNFTEEKKARATVKSERKSPTSPSLPRSKSSTPPQSSPSSSVSPQNLSAHMSAAPFIQGMMSSFLSMPASGMSPQGLCSIPSVSKCADCNIVFYKHENYLIHKEHYCSGKKHKHPSPQKTCESSSDSSENNTLIRTPPMDVLKSEPTEEKNGDSADKNKQDNQVADDVCYRFFCVPCKIKFSSASTLKAHKEFYCPHGKDSGHSVIIQTQSALDEDAGPQQSGKEKSEYRCDQCESVFTTSRLLKLHLCSGESTSMPLLRCPHCDYVTQTENRLSDHMKVHAPTRAFRCTFCGYRGNTVRGMRMHGKMHIDNGEEFTDENMVEYEEPPLIPIQTNGQTTQGPLDVEAELIRLKNEPYKRRRSRKSFEKTEYIVPSSLQSQFCPVCGLSFPNVKLLNSHMRIHDVALKYHQQDVLKCGQCEFEGKSENELCCHTLDSHKKLTQNNEEETTKKSPSPEKRITKSEAPSIELTSNVKQEPADEGFDAALQGSKSGRTSDPSLVKCDKENVLKREIVSDGSSLRKSPLKNSPVSSPNNGPVTIKLQDSSEKEDTKSTNSHSIIFPSGSVFPYFIIPSSSGAGAPQIISPRSLSPKIESHGPKYCKNCDISFTYLSTFLAHKKYYCTPKPSEELSPSATA